MKFTEAKLEKAFTESLGNKNFPNQLAITIFSCRRRTPSCICPVTTALS
jgi:hypothetical protein